MSMEWGIVKGRRDTSERRRLRRGVLGGRKDIESDNSPNKRDSFAKSDCGISVFGSDLVKVICVRSPGSGVAEDETVENICRKKNRNFGTFNQKQSKHHLVFSFVW